VEAKGEAAHDEHLTAFEIVRLPGGDLGAVDHGAIGRAVVSHRDRARQDEVAVAFGDRILGDADVAVRISAQRDGARRVRRPAALRDFEHPPHHPGQRDLRGVGHGHRGGFGVDLGVQAPDETKEDEERLRIGGAKTREPLAGENLFQLALVDPGC